MARQLKPNEIKMEGQSYDGQMVECAHWTSDLQAAGWCHLWWATPQKSSRQGVVGAGLTPHRWQTPPP